MALRGCGCSGVQSENSALFFFLLWGYLSCFVSISVFLFSLSVFLGFSVGFLLLSLLVHGDLKALVTKHNLFGYSVIFF